MKKYAEKSAAWNKFSENPAGTNTFGNWLWALPNKKNYG